VTQAFLQCPSTRVVMGGYSQGGQVLHKAAALLPASTMEAVNSIIIFGDPGTGLTSLSLFFFVRINLYGHHG
jgi:cutinase